MILRRGKSIKQSIDMVLRRSICSLSSISFLRHYRSVLLPFHLPVSSSSSSSSSSSRSFRTRPTASSSSSLKESSFKCSNRVPKERSLVEGCDYEHWLVVMEGPKGSPQRDQIIDGYIKTLAMVLGSEEEAKKSIYSVSTKYYYAFGCKVLEELSYKIRSLPNVRWVLPDSYLHVEEKDYGGEPFIDGKAVPYDEKYHMDWLRNVDDVKNGSRGKDRSRNQDNSIKFERQ